MKAKSSKRSVRTTKASSKKRTSSKAKQTSSVWEFIPFALAVTVAVIVISQSLNHAKSIRSLDTAQSGRLAPMHSASSCEPNGSVLREMRSAERAVSRQYQIIEEAQRAYHGSCSSDSAGSKCHDAKNALKKAGREFQSLIKDAERLQIEACL